MDFFYRQTLYLFLIKTIPNLINFKFNITLDNNLEILFYYKYKKNIVYSRIKQNTMLLNNETKKKIQSKINSYRNIYNELLLYNHINLPILNELVYDKIFYTFGKYTLIDIDFIKETIINEINTNITNNNNLHIFHYIINIDFFHIHNKKYPYIN